MENTSGSQNANLCEGATDGVYKKVVQNRGGVVERTTYASRAALSDHWYGIHEAAVKDIGDGTMHATPDFVATPAAQVI